MTITPGGAESTGCYWPFPVSVFTLVTVCRQGSPPGTELSNITMNSASSRWDRERSARWISTFPLDFHCALTPSGQFWECWPNLEIFVTPHWLRSDPAFHWQPAGRARGTVHCEFKCSDNLNNVQYISCECSVQNLHTILIFMICLTTSIILWLDKSWNCQHYEEIRKGKFCSSWCVRGERRNLISNFNFSKVRWMLVWCPRMTKVKSS